MQIETCSPENMEKNKREQYQQQPQPLKNKREKKQQRKEKERRELKQQRKEDTKEEEETKHGKHKEADCHACGLKMRADTINRHIGGRQCRK